MDSKDKILKILEKYNGDRGALISILEKIQDDYAYLPEDALRTVADRTGLSLVDVYGVATFYKSFRLKPRGKHLASVCLGTACHVRGAPKIIEEFERQLDIQSGETTPDKEFTLEAVKCLGACALGPIVVVDNHYFSKVTPLRVKEILKRAAEGLDAINTGTAQQDISTEVCCPRCRHTLMDPGHPIENLPSIKVYLSSKGKKGWLRISSLYESETHVFEYPVQDNTLGRFFCPYCHTPFASGSICTECAAPMVQLMVQGGGILQICSRLGCTNELLDFTEDNFEFERSLSLFRAGGIGEKVHAKV